MLRRMAKKNPAPLTGCRHIVCVCSCALVTTCVPVGQGRAEQPVHLRTCMQIVLQILRTAVQVTYSAAVRLCPDLTLGLAKKLKAVGLRDWTT